MTKLLISSAFPYARLKSFGLWAADRLSGNSGEEYFTLWKICKNGQPVEPSTPPAIRTTSDMAYEAASRLFVRGRFDSFFLRLFGGAIPCLGKPEF